MKQGTSPGFESVAESCPSVVKMSGYMFSDLFFKPDPLVRRYRHAHDAVRMNSYLCIIGVGYGIDEQVIFTPL